MENLKTFKDGSHEEMLNGHKVILGPNEHIDEGSKCPVCRGDTYTNYGSGISISYCELCGWEFTDYDDFDDFDDFD